MIAIAPTLPKYELANTKYDSAFGVEISRMVSIDRLSTSAMTTPRRRFAPSLRCADTRGRRTIVVTIRTISSWSQCPVYSGCPIEGTVQNSRKSVMWLISKSSNTRSTPINRAAESACETMASPRVASTFQLCRQEEQRAKRERERERERWRGLDRCNVRSAGLTRLCRQILKVQWMISGHS
jgi:hypothetical protein